METQPAFWQPPSVKQKLTWLSTLTIVFFGPSIYPQRHPAHLRSEGRADAATFLPDHGLHADLHHLLHVRRRSGRGSPISRIGSAG